MLVLTEFACKVSFTHKMLISTGVIRRCLFMGGNSALAVLR